MSASPLRASAWSTAARRELRDVAIEVAGSRDGATVSSPVRVVPDGSADLLVSSPLGAPGDLVELSVYGVKTRALDVRSPTRVENAAIRIRAPYLGRLFGVGAAALTDRAVPLRELWGAAADRVADALARSNDFAARKAILESALLERAAPCSDAELALAAARILEARGGRIRIGELARTLACGERRLLRAFRRHVGVAPKTFAGIVRFRASWQDLARGEAQVRVAARRGYADQAHLLREFRRFAGARPGAVGFVQSGPTPPH